MVYSEQQKKVGTAYSAFPGKIPPTPLYERGARGDFGWGFLVLSESI